MATVNTLARDIAPPQTTKLPPEIRRALGYVGIFGRVAKRMEVTRGHVSAVVRGHRQSPRIVAAIVEEVRKIDAAAQKGRAA